MWHFLRYRHFKTPELLGTYTFFDYEAWSTYCLTCHPHKVGTETLTMYLRDHRRYE